ncbi:MULTISPECIES: Fe2+-dependent dioxygenase [Pseudomonas]|uniref:PKHD-type hydroxylase n=1 Tax=Pseudomonas lutea TaxID=243924 RepID=A0A9X8QJ44_9PSED|nr:MULTISPECIES: Fe2+-dependent dioxygenase [Pseudomonas]SEQ35172.1 PKHD-type hydroxylase [Pseudomonas lutea]
MLVHIPGVFSPEEACDIEHVLRQAKWGDGKVTAGHQSARAKHNIQLPEDDPVSIELGNQIVQRLSHHPVFVSAVLPRKVFPPLFNCYREGGSFGFHIDNAIRALKGHPERVRTDVSATLFFSSPDTYDGGELIIQDTYGEQQVKLPAGDMVIYPATSLHRVAPVTCGARIASFFWTQSLVRDDGHRRLLYDLDQAIQRLTRDVPDHEALLALTGTYHNLLRQWADV